MIKEFVAAWDANKTHLEEYISTHNQSEYDSYKKLLTLLVKIVLNPYLGNLQDDYTFIDENIHEVDDGDYTGDKIFLIPKSPSEPSVYDYIWTYQGYGSCSGCDTLLGISRYEEGLPTKEQVDGYMTIELHLLQRCKWLIDEDVYFKEVYDEG